MNKLRSHNPTYPAQILLVSLLVLMIIAIIVVGVVGVATRDVVQTTSNKQYQKLYNASESIIYKVIDKYGDAATNLSSLIAEPFVTGSCLTDGANVYTCNFVEQGVNSEMQVLDTPKIKDYEISKDSSLDLNLAGFRGNMVLSWTGDTAIEFGLLYDVTGTTGFIADLYDTASVFDASGNLPTLRSTPENHPFLFRLDASGGITFKIDDIVGLPSTAKTISLRLTARMGAAQGVTKINLTADNGLPNQIREFTVTSYEAASDVQSTATVVTLVPLMPQSPSIFNYALLTGGIVDKSLSSTSAASSMICTPNSTTVAYCSGNEIIYQIAGIISNYSYACCIPSANGQNLSRGSCTDVAYGYNQLAMCPEDMFMVGATPNVPISSIRCCNYAGAKAIKQKGVDTAITYNNSFKTCALPGEVLVGIGDKLAPDAHIDQLFCSQGGE